jgi:hypothetical protein
VIGHAEVQEFVDDDVVAEVFVEAEEFGVVEDEQVGALVVRRPFVFIARRAMVCTSTPIFSAHSRTRCLKVSGVPHVGTLRW